MLKLHGMMCVLGLVTFGHPAMGAGTLHLNLVPRDTVMVWGGTMQIDIYADWSGVTGGLSMAGFKFDVIGNANGTLAGDVNNDSASTGFVQGVNNGIASGANLLDFGAGQLPSGLGGSYFDNPAFLGTLTYTDLHIEPNYTVQLSIEDYFSPEGSLNVYIGASGTQSRPNRGIVGGSGHEVVINAMPFDVIVPAPGTAAALAAGALVMRRRRQVRRVRTV